MPEAPLMGFPQPDGGGWEAYVKLSGRPPRDWPRVPFPAGRGGRGLRALASLPAS
ncbi:hypothetical protein OOK36_55920 [Streptomyces sp. NBC_00365]|uniref:hypothetical protein n=1 Tax=Streptomyces sp. NBC_00365 TaxID=2975726 RepID=UPI002250CED5|nr:hypothetical protein [Streptomyces sp. NBC_00365]MCX5097745.1 hypothetical protein [Streptomyces sp. NBC_00365]